MTKLVSWRIHWPTRKLSICLYDSRSLAFHPNGTLTAIEFSINYLSSILRKKRYSKTRSSVDKAAQAYVYDTPKKMKHPHSLKRSLATAISRHPLDLFIWNIRHSHKLAFVGTFSALWPSLERSQVRGKDCQLISWPAGPLWMLQGNGLVILLTDHRCHLRQIFFCPPLRVSKSQKPLSWHVWLVYVGLKGQYLQYFQWTW